MGCQKEIAQAIREQGADYILAVKDNQPRLAEDLMASFAEAFEGERGETYRLRATNEKGHGREERREYVVVRDLSKIRDRHLWPDLHSLAMVCSERTIDGQTSTERRTSSAVARVRHDKLPRRFGALGNRKQPALVARRDLRRGRPLFAKGPRPGKHGHAFAARP